MRRFPLPCPGARLTGAVLIAGAVLLAAAQHANAQIPDKFENLKVLPKDITRDQLITVMRGFSTGLGVRCQYCHEVKQGAPAPAPGAMEELDFKSDRKAEKDVARVMMKMAATINDSLLAKIPDRVEPGVRVTCVTCHRGSPLPRLLDGVLAQTIEEAGVDSAIAQYRKLRAETMALGRYNFGEPTLSDLARQLVMEKKTDEAIRILELNQEHFPASANIDFQIGEIHRGRGEREQAVARYRKALEKAPNHQQAKRRLAELGG